MLRNKLEQMEALLTQTRTKLADANQQLEAKDQRLRNVSIQLLNFVLFVCDRYRLRRRYKLKLKH